MERITVFFEDESTQEFELPAEDMSHTNIVDWLNTQIPKENWLCYEFNPPATN